MSRKPEGTVRKATDSKIISFSKPKTVLLGPVIKEYRKRAGMSQKDLAEMMDVTRNTVINWESDKNKPDYDTIPGLCAILGIPLSELFGMQNGIALSAAEERIVGNYRQLSAISQRVIDKMISTMLQEEINERDKALKAQYRLFEKIPGSVAAGTGSYIPNEPASYCFLRTNDRNAKADGIIRVSGQSMEPIYHDGEYVYIQYTSAADPGEDVVCYSADGCVIKRVNADQTLYSLNPAYPYGNKSEDDNVRVFGRVLGIVSSSDRPAKSDEALLEDFFQDEIRNFRRDHNLDDWN